MALTSEIHTEGLYVQTWICVHGRAVQDSTRALFYSLKNPAECSIIPSNSELVHQILAHLLCTNKGKESDFFQHKSRAESFFFTCLKFSQLL